MYALRVNSLTNFGYCVFTSVILVNTSNLLDLEPEGQFRSISGTLCVQEWERFCAFFPTIFREDALFARIYEDAISFSTRAKGVGSTGTSSGEWCLDWYYTFVTHTLKGRSGLNKMFGKASSSKSPIKTVASPTKSGNIRGALNFNDTGISVSFLNDISLTHLYVQSPYTTQQMASWIWMLYICYRSNWGHGRKIWMSVFVLLAIQLTPTRKIRWRIFHWTFNGLSCLRNYSRFVFS